MKFEIDRKKEKLILVDSNPTELNQLKLHLTRKVKGYQFKKKYKLGIWDGTISYFKNGYIDLGLWYEVFCFCRNNNYKFEITNKEELPIDKNITLEKIQQFCEYFFHDHKDQKGEDFFPYQHQIHSVYKALRSQHSLIEIATGGGKSLFFSIVLFYIIQNIKQNVKFLLIVPRTSLVRQFYDDLIDYNWGFNNDNTRAIKDLNLKEIMGADKKPRITFPDKEVNLFIGTYQSLSKKERGFFNQFDGVVSDECHTAKSNSINYIMQSTFGYAGWRFGMTGTLPESDTLEILTLQSLMGPQTVRVEATELMNKNIISNVRIKAILLNHQDPEFNNVLYDIRKGGDGRKAFELEKEYVQKSEKRTWFIINDILQKVNKNTLLLFFNIEYGTNLYNRARDHLVDKNVYYIDGETDEEKRSYIKDAMEITSEKPNILIASYGTVSTGISIKSLCNIILSDSFKSEQIVIQSIGRILRLHEEKDIANVFDLVDIIDGSVKSPNILQRHYYERRKFYKKRNYPYKEVKYNL